MSVRKEAKDYFEKLATPFMGDINVSESQHDKYDVKYHHPYRVADIIVDLAIDLNMSDYDVDLAYVIGLLHDVGRFEQIKQFNSFDDLSTIDHGDLGADMLKDARFLNNFYSTEDMELIYLAVKAHSKFKIDESIKDNRILTFCKLIRDADKLDILNIWCGHYYDTYYKEKLANQELDRKVSPEVYQSIVEKRCVDKKHAKNEIDEIFVGLNFLFDLNYQKSFGLFKKRKYIEKFFLLINDIPEYHNIEDNYIDYLNKHLEEK